MDVILYLFAAIFGVGIALRFLLRRTIIYEYERGLLYVRGAFRRTLDPGPYWFSPLRSRIDRVDVRLRVVTVPGQEVLSADAVTLKISLAARYEVTDPARATNRVQNYADALYLELQLELRALVGETSADELLERRQELSRRLHEASRARAGELGLELHDVSIKDIMFPGELKKIFAQVVKARKDGLAALERARGETAALRHLANAARMMENNPALLQLRTLQTLGDGTGHTVVFGAPGPTGSWPPPSGGAKEDPANGNGSADR